MSKSTMAPAGTCSTSAHTATADKIAADHMRALVSVAERMMKASLEAQNEWIVVDPQGQMFKGTVEEMTQILLREHPLLKNLSPRRL